MKCLSFKNNAKALRNSNFATQWLSKNESENFAQKHDPEIIKKDKRAEVEGEVIHSKSKEILYIKYNHLD